MRLQIHSHVTEFFPQSAQYEYAENVEFEVYSSQDVSDPNYKCEIWIAVNEKTEQYKIGYMRRKNPSGRDALRDFSLYYNGKNNRIK